MLITLATHSAIALTKANAAILRWMCWKLGPSTSTLKGARARRYVISSECDPQAGLE